MSGPDSENSIDRVLIALNNLATEVQATREEGHARHEQNKRVHGELRDAIQRCASVVEGQGHVLVQRGTELAEVLERLDAHERLIRANTDNAASNSIVLAEHARLIGDLKDALSGVREWAREAKQAATDLVAANAGFQAGVQAHVGGLAKTFNDRTDALAENDKEQNVQLGTILQVLGVPPPADGEKVDNTKPPPRTALTQLQTAGKIAVATTAGSTLLLILKILYEVLKSH